VQSDREYVSSVTLVITGESLDPDDVSRNLGLDPDQAWRKGDTKQFGERVHRYPHGGWKRYLPESFRNQPFEDQLAYWASLLGDHLMVFREIEHQGHDCVLSCFITTDETASIVVPPELQCALASLGLNIELSVWTGSHREAAS
jgi:hypothetical protein